VVLGIQEQLKREGAGGFAAFAILANSRAEEQERTRAWWGDAPSFGYAPSFERRR
jgi:hypothetical protein